MIFSSVDRKRFFLVPEGATLAEGGYEVQALTGEKRSVDEKQIAAHEVSEDVAKEHVGRRMAAIAKLVKELDAFAAAVVNVTAEVRRSHDTERIERVLALAGVSLSSLQEDPQGTVQKIAQKLRGVALDALETLTRG